MAKITSIPIKHTIAYQSVGKKINKLLITGIVGSKQGNTIASYLCDCGTVGQCELYRIKSGHTKACGCLAKTHGESKTTLYGVWCSLKNRTTLESVKCFHNYGGRGIGVCDEWLKYINFRDWALSNGWRKGLTIERMDNDAGYTPSNCKIATYKEQANNKRNTIYITIGIDTRTISEWADLKGIKYRILWDRINRNWPQERLFSTPRKRRH